MPAHYSPPFTITPAILSLVAEIAGEVGRLGAVAGQGSVPKLRRENRIKSIHASLEQRAYAPESTADSPHYSPQGDRGSGRHYRPSSMPKPHTPGS